MCLQPQKKMKIGPKEAKIGQKRAQHAQNLLQNIKMCQLCAFVKNNTFEIVPVGRSASRTIGERKKRMFWVKNWSGKVHFWVVFGRFLTVFGSKSQVG